MTAHFGSVSTFIESMSVKLKRVGGKLKRVGPDTPERSGEKPANRLVQQLQCYFIFILTYI